MGTDTEIIATIKDLKTTLSGIAISDSITAQISGQTVIAKISGETIIGKVSGEILGLASGTGPIIARISGDTVIAKISGETIIGKISGETIIGKISGETIFGKVSGETVIAKISGETVVGKVSGEIIDVKVPTSVKTGLVRVVTGASGGAVLHSGAVNSVLVKAIDGNSGDIYVGGAVNRPYSGFGCPLAEKEGVNMNVDNFNRIYVFATVSGDKVGFLGVA